MRENLFSGWVNSVMTVIAFLLIARFIMGVFPWFWNGVWDATSIKDCRNIMADAGTAGSACFAVLVDRWDHLLFGFKYPATEYWRPTLAFVLLVVCAMPALFAMYLPRKLLIATALYPFVAYWLIWGGSLWVPVVILGLLAVTAVIYLFIEGLSVSLRQAVAGIVGALSGIGLGYLLYLGAQELWFISGNVSAGKASFPQWLGLSL